MQESKIFTPCKLGPITLRNRTIRSAAFEGMCANNAPTEMLYNYHKSVAEGGIGMTTIAYASVTRNGLSFPHQLWMREEIVPDLRKITDAIHNAGAAASIQLGHCGNMSKKSVAGQLPVSASNGFNIYSPTFVRRSKRDEIIDLAKAYGKSVKLAIDAGFDAVEIHAGHGYLIGQFLSKYTNHRHDEYGGSLENRMRFMNMVMNECLEAGRGKIAVTAKINMYDGFKYFGGLKQDDCIKVARQLELIGLDALTLSGGFVSKAPMHVMRGSMPMKTMSYYMQPSLVKILSKYFGRILVPTVPYKEGYFLEDAKKFREKLNIPLIYVGGLISKKKIEEVLDSGFEFVSMARALIHDPSFVNKMKEAEGDINCGCDHLNYCVARMYSREMACYYKVKDELPKCIIKEIEKEKQKQH
ncbi:MAG: NADH:flavin oxidoreductase [Bacteroidales bacterium]|jgi:2,4-dienoyl-CoA reductase-like NADH-dependent reductase (Old Yellow Enzyme family)